MNGVFRLLLCASIACTSLYAGRSRAEPVALDAPVHPPSGSSARSELRTKGEWFGYQTVLWDGACLSAVLLGQTYDRFAHPRGLPLVRVGVLAYLGGAPMIHALHGNGRPALQSMVMHGGGPLIGAFGGAMTMMVTVIFVLPGSGCSGCNARLNGGALFGAAFGALGASVFDAAVLAYAPVAPRELPRSTATASAASGLRWQMLPWFEPRAAGVVVVGGY